jgi:aromatic ring hydroxylase
MGNHPVDSGHFRWYVADLPSDKDIENPEIGPVEYLKEKIKCQVEERIRCTD